MFRKIFVWKIWGFIGVALGIMFLGLKKRGDYYKGEAEQAREEADASVSVQEVKGFQKIEATLEDIRGKKIKEIDGEKVTDTTELISNTY